MKFMNKRREKFFIIIDIRLNGWRRLAELFERSGQPDQAGMALLENLKLAQKTDVCALAIDAHTDLFQFYRTMRRKVTISSTPVSVLKKSREPLYQCYRRILLLGLEDNEDIPAVG